MPAAAALAAVLLLTSLVPAATAHGLVAHPLGGPSTPLAAPHGGSTAAVAPADPVVHGIPVAPVPVPALAADDPANLLTALPWEASAPVLPDLGTRWRPLVVDGADVTGASAPVRGSMTFWCPGGADGGTSIENGQNTFTVRATCPYRIIDDADLMGSPQIAVNENDPNSLAFFSLHGAGTTQGPTPRSRDPNPEGPEQLTGLSHTTFTTQDQGRAWFDNPWGTDGFGEHVTGVMDHDGNLYIGALWSKRLGDGQFNYVVKVYKEQDGRFQITNYQPSKTFPNRAAGNAIEQANLVYVPKQAVYPVVAENGTGNATAPAGEEDIGNATAPEDIGVHNDPDDRVVLVWHERALDWRNATTGKSSWIDAAWSDTSARDNWTRLADDQLIGPCMAASKPVQWNGKAYVACVADAGYRGRSRAHVGDIDVWSIDPMTGNTRLEEFTGLSGGQPNLVARGDGYMAITTTRVVDTNDVDVDLAWGWYGSHWGDIVPIGARMHQLASNTATSSLPQGTPQPPPASNSVREARITAMALSEETSSLFLVYMERVNVGDVSDVNPTSPFVSPDSAIEYKKLVATFTRCEGPTNVYDLQLGVARHPFAESIVGNATGVFDDLQDGMQSWKDPASGEERIYFAYGDHGVIQYGALVTQDSQPLSICPTVAPPPFLPAVATPAGLTASSPASAVIGSAVGLTTTAMVGYLLAVKRKTLSALAAKAKK